MGNFNLTPNMGLPNPVPGTDPGPDYANNLQTSLNIVDNHNHAPGSGVQITPNGIYINAALPFNNNPATLLAYLGITPQGAGIPTPINDSIYVSGVDLYYQDGNGNPVRITSGGSVFANSSSLSNPPASASFVSSILVVQQSSGVGAAIDAATYILRYNGSYPSPSGNYILLAAPSSLATGFQITFQNNTPGVANAFWVSDTSGTLSYVIVDGSTLSISAGIVGVPTGGITATQIANQTITATQIANQTITATQIANNTITGSQVQSSVNLPGNAVQENGLNVVVSAANASTSLKVLWGSIAANGSILAGTGFSVSHTVTGGYTINFTTAFGSTPSPLATLGGANQGSIQSSSSGTSSAAFTVNDLTGVAQNYPFSFIIVGPR